MVPPSNTATDTADDDQLNLLCAATPWVVKNHVPGVASKPTPVKVPVPLIARKDPFWKAIVADARLKEKLSGPPIVHNGDFGVEGLNTQGCVKVTAVPSSTLSNEPDPSSTSANSQDWMPVAAAILVVTLPAESCRTIPPPAPEEKLIEPVIKSA